MLGSYNLNSALLKCKRMNFSQQCNFSANWHTPNIKGIIVPCALFHRVVACVYILDRCSCTADIYWNEVVTFFSQFTQRSCNTLLHLWVIHNKSFVRWHSFSFFCHFLAKRMVVEGREGKNERSCRTKTQISPFHSLFPFKIIHTNAYSHKTYLCQVVSFDQK